MRVLGSPGLSRRFSQKCCCDKAILLLLTLSWAGTAGASGTQELQEAICVRTSGEWWCSPRCALVLCSITCLIQTVIAACGWVCMATSEWESRVVVSGCSIWANKIPLRLEFEITSDSWGAHRYKLGSLCYSHCTGVVGVCIGQAYSALRGKIDIKLYEYLGILRENQINFLEINSTR